MFRETMRRLVGTAAAGLLAATMAFPAAAQTAEGDGFLIGEPTARLNLRLGLSQPRASSDLFRESFDSLTLSRGSFRAPDFGAELGIRLTSMLDFTLGAEYAGRSAKSDYRYFYDNNRQPIEQTTTFQRIPITAGLKAYLASPGRSIGTLAWIPSRFVPWVGAAAGASYYRFAQEGDFIGAGATMPVYHDALVSTGWGFAAQGSAGVDVSVTARTALTFEGRYTRAHAPLNRNYYDGYEALDLSGGSLAVGLTFRM